jgi:hypothetical protein
MFKGIHDSLLIEYSVSSESRNLILSINPHHGSAPAPFSVIFEGVAAHCFPSPLLPAILLDIVSVSAKSLIRDEWASLKDGFKECGWPGPWADTLDNAQKHAASAGLKGFRIESSYGLSGWVLAQSAKLENES